MRDVYTLVAANCQLTPTELDEMPQSMVDRLLLYLEVLNVVRYGGEIS